MDTRQNKNLLYTALELHDLLNIYETHYDKLTRAQKKGLKFKMSLKTYLLIYIYMRMKEVYQQLLH